MAYGSPNSGEPTVGFTANHGKPTWMMGYGYRDMCHPQIHRISMEYPSISIFGFLDSPFDMVAQLHGLCLWEDTVLLMDKILHQVLTVSYGKSPIYNAVSEEEHV